MPQGPISVNPFTNQTTSLNIDAATVVKETQGWLMNLVVSTAGSDPGAVYDSNDESGGAVAANLICEIPNTVGVMNFQGFPFVNGLLVVPGTGQVVAVAHK